MDGADFSSLNEGCITHILSLTSPLDVCRSSSVSSAFQSAAESDSIWERFLPSDYSDILSRSVSPVHFSSKKDLYFRLCQPLLIDDGKKMNSLDYHMVGIEKADMFATDADWVVTLPPPLSMVAGLCGAHRDSFWLEKSSGKKCYMVSARDLSISWGDDDRYWRWPTAPSISVFSEVAELISVWWFDLRGTIDMAHLSPDTNYTVRFVVRHTSNHAGWKNMPVKLSLHVKSNPYMHIRDVLMSPDQAESVLQPSVENNGWMEVEVGEFLCDRDGGEVEFRMYELHRYKKGIVVMGVEIRPSKMHCEEMIHGILGSEQISVPSSVERPPSIGYDSEESADFSTGYDSEEIAAV